MRITWKLALAYAWRHPARMLLTSLAMVASACVVVWVVSGYDAILSQFGNRASEYLGRYDLFLVPDSLGESFVPAELIEAIRKDNAVAELEPALQWTVRVQTDKPVEMGMGGPPGGGGLGKAGPDMGGPGMGGPPKRGGPGKGGFASGKAAGKAGPPGGRGGMAGGPPMGMFFGGPKLVGTNAATPPYELLEGRWLDHSDPRLREAVVSSQSAEQLEIKLGEEVLVIFGTKEYRLKIVGIVAQASSPPPTIQKKSTTGRPMMSGPGATLGPAASALYVPTPLAEKITRQSGKVNLVSIKLREGASAAEFRTRWLAQVAQARPAVLLVGAVDLTSAMEEGMMAANTKRQAWAATGMSLLAALFIIFTTLSMGVDERVRQFAVMRAVGLTRFQVACIIAAESLVLALIGWGGGLAAGWGLLRIVSAARPDLFLSGASLGTWCVLLTGASAFGGALIAAILPAWQATRVQPLEAMLPRRPARPSMKSAAMAGAAGIALIAVNPLLVYAMPIADAARYGVYLALGCTSMALGFLLLAPLAIVATETAFGPWIARGVRLEPRLVRSQLTSNLWRALGTTVALSVGLGLYVSMMVWGYSMLGPFKPGDWVPDMLVAIQSGGLPDAEIEAVRRIEGVIPEQCIPLAVEQPRLASDITGSEQGNSVTRQDNVIMIGLDPQVAFGGPRPLIGAQFVQGTREQVVGKLKQGRYCIVPDHFLLATGLKIGDRFGMIPPEKPDEPVQYTIAGAVSLPGWHWMTKFSGLRRRSGRSAAMVFAGYDDVRRDFGLKQVNFFWMNVDQGFGQKHLEEVVKAEAARKEVARGDAMFSRGPMPTDLVVDAKRAAVVKIGEALRPIAERYVGERQPVNAQGMWSVGATMFGQSLRISTPDEVRTRILARADDMIWAMCQLPLITLLVTSLGVVNTVMASVRARRWELGVLRALGVTRWAMSRMILAEGLLIGLIACLMSLAFGVMAGWCGTGISQYVSFFGGMATPLVVPWSKLALGFSAALALCLVAALWPAISTGRAEPLRLLQEGRAAM
jgi:putative ABC transport system permease protein